MGVCALRAFGPSESPAHQGRRAFRQGRTVRVAGNRVSRRCRRRGRARAVPHLVARLGTRHRAHARGARHGVGENVGGAAGQVGRHTCAGHGAECGTRTCCLLLSVHRVGAVGRPPRSASEAIVSYRAQRIESISNFSPLPFTSPRPLIASIQSFPLPFNSSRAHPPPQHMPVAAGRCPRK